MRVFFSGLVAVVMLSGGLPAAVAASGHTASQSPQRSASDAVDVEVQRVPAATPRSVERRADVEPDADLVAELKPQATEEYALMGVTWADGFDHEGLTVSVRLREGDDWEPWRELAIDHAEGEGGRGGTEPLWVGSADGVGVRVSTTSGDRPSDLEIVTINPGDDEDSAAPAAATSLSNGVAQATPAADGSPTYTAEPAVISRSSWGARKNSYCDRPRFGKQTKAVIVHHTAGTNSYSKSQSKSIVRAIQAYHMDGRDWCDIGYNFLVDKYGQIFEGRSGGTKKPVRGAHAGTKPVNTVTMGVSMMGTFTGSEPSAALKDAMVKVVGWRLGTNYLPATGKVGIGGKTFNRISGHRDVVGTACPGAAGYAWLSRSGGLRDRVKNYISDYSSAIKTASRSMGSKRTGVLFVGEYGTDTFRKARFDRKDFYWQPSQGVHYVGGHIRTEYAQLDAQNGPVGRPRSDPRDTSDPDVILQRFKHGSIYRVQGTGRAFGMWGAIEDKYRDLGEESSELGAPRRRMVKKSDGRFRAYFVDGRITLLTNGDLKVKYL